MSSSRFVGHLCAIYAAIECLFNFLGAVDESGQGVQGSTDLPQQTLGHYEQCFIWPESPIKSSLGFFGTFCTVAIECVRNFPGGEGETVCDSSRDKDSQRPSTEQQQPKGSGSVSVSASPRRSRAGPTITTLQLG